MSGRECRECGHLVPEGALQCPMCGTAASGTTAQAGALAPAPVTAASGGYSDGLGVRVTSDHVESGGRRLALAEVKSVKVTTVPASTAWPLVTTICGASIVSSAATGASSGGGPLGVILLIVGLVWLRRRRPSFEVVLLTEQGEKVLVASSELPYCSVVAEAVQRELIGAAGRGAAANGQIPG